MHIFVFLILRTTSILSHPPPSNDASSPLFLSFFLSFFLHSRVRARKRGRPKTNPENLNSLRIRSVSGSRSSIPSPSPSRRPLRQKDTRFRARISNTRGDHIWQHTHKYLHPKDILFRARISNTRGDHSRQHQNKSLYSKDIRFRARIANTRAEHLRQL